MILHVVLVSRLTTVNGILDIVATCNDSAALEVDVIEVVFSDHRLVRWTSNLAKPPPAYTTSTYRRDIIPWSTAVISPVHRQRWWYWCQTTRHSLRRRDQRHCRSSHASQNCDALQSSVVWPMVRWRLSRYPSPMLTCWTPSNSTPRVRRWCSCGAAVLSDAATFEKHSLLASCRWT